MLSFVELNKTWAKTLRAHAIEPLFGDEGKPYRAIGEKSLRFLDELWKARKAPLPDIGAMIASGKKVRFWADPHFSHEAIIGMAHRTEFRNVDEMDRVIWSNIEQAEAESDLLVCLGDLALKNPLSVQQKLRNAFQDRQIICAGNHDVKGGKPEAWAACNGTSSLAFTLPTELVREWIESDFADMAGLVEWNRLPNHINFGCAHWPVPPDRMPGPSWINIHGHIHFRTPGPLRINCSVEAIGYVPKTLRELVTVDLLDGLVRRQRGLDGFTESQAKTPGDAEYSDGIPSWRK
jgi:calcineurin-like phosphoesterase family protein